MTARLVFAPEAEQDVVESHRWYEAQRLGLGREFLNCVEATLEAIRRIPDMHSVIHKAYRRALVRRFPYAVFYEYERGVVTVYAILHTSRNPEKWRFRLS
jgi:plasmid stabilization system protein ParE